MILLRVIHLQTDYPPYLASSIHVKIIVFNEVDCFPYNRLMVVAPALAPANLARLLQFCLHSRQSILHLRVYPHRHQHHQHLQALTLDLHNWHHVTVRTIRGRGRSCRSGTRLPGEAEGRRISGGVVGVPSCGGLCKEYTL